MSCDSLGERPLVAYRHTAQITLAMVPSRFILPGGSFSALLGRYQLIPFWTTSPQGFKETSHQGSLFQSSTDEVRPGVQSYPSRS